jgi:hypothetical protein
MPKKREVKKRKPNKRILILCEGKETEPNYFQGLKSDKFHQNKLAALRIEIYDPKQNRDKKKNTGKELIVQAKRLKQGAEAEKNPYDDIWIVIDKDGYTKHPQTFDHARGNKIKIAFSSISFEFWFLLHFKFTTKSYQKADDLISYLTRYMQDYDKVDDNYSFLKDKTQIAIENAQRVREYRKVDIERGTQIYELNPYTDVDLLVKNLLNL